MKSKLVEQQKLIEMLQERLSKFERPILNSSNSSIPPSAQTISEKAKFVKRTVSLREKSGKSSGGQVGHDGETLLFNINPDEIIVHSPERCKKCGSPLEEIVGAVVDERQSIDIPLPIKPIVTNHQIVEKRCSCGECNRPYFPNHVRSYVSYGPNVYAIVSYLNVCQHIPYNRLTQVMKQFYGITISQGTVNNILLRMKAQSEVGYEAIRLQIEKSLIVGGDETSSNINGKSHWMWVFQNAFSTYVFFDLSRGFEAIIKKFPNGLPVASFISDRHSPYFKMIIKSHQLCLAHLLRNLKYLEEIDKKQTWATRMLGIMMEAIDLRRDYPDKVYNVFPFRDRFEALLKEDLKGLDKGFENIKAALTKHKDKLFLFLLNPDVPFDNNGAERAIRPLKIKQKVSGQFKTDGGAKIFCQLHSIADTAKKNKQSPFLAFVAIAENI